MNEAIGRDRKKMLKIKDLHASVADKPILNGINLEINPGEIHAIMGPNGSGKSTLSNVIAGRDGYEVTSGSIEYNGKDLMAVSYTHLTLPTIYSV